MAGYTFRKSILTQDESWTVTPEGLALAQNGVSYAICPYQHISRIRLAYFPTNYKPNNYYCKLTIQTPLSQTFTISSVSYRGIGDFEDKSESYVEFVNALISAVAKANPSCTFLAGQKWPNYLFAQFMVLAVVLMLYFLLTMVGTSAVSGITAIKLILVVYYIYYVIKSIRINLPGKFLPEHIPAKLLPVL